MYNICCVFYRTKGPAAASGISIPYGYAGGFVSGLPLDQTLRPAAAYPFLMPTGQYVTQMPYAQQVSIIMYMYIFTQHFTYSNACALCLGKVKVYLML